MNAVSRLMISAALLSCSALGAAAEENRGDGRSPLIADAIPFSYGCGLRQTELSDDIREIEPARKYLDCVRKAFAAQKLDFAQADNFAAHSALHSLETSIVEAAKRDLRIAEADNQFRGLSWGLGFGFSFGEDDFIESAEIVDGVVRVTDDQTQRARVLLEFHKYFWCNKKKPALRGCGPFIALAAESNDVLKGVGTGFMWGWRGEDRESSDGFSVGVGVVLDNDVKALADGFVENEAPPGSETAVRLRQESRWSALVFMTRTF